MSCGSSHRASQAEIRVLQQDLMQLHLQPARLQLHLLVLLVLLPALALHQVLQEEVKVLSGSKSKHYSNLHYKLGPSCAVVYIYFWL